MSTAAPRIPIPRIALALGRCSDRVFGMGQNPWHQLGALGFYLFWLVAATGIYLYALFDTSASGAYRSVERLTGDPWYVGGLIRSLHRYASDALVAVVALHLVRELLHGHWRSFRRFSWLSGVPLIWLVYASGLGGYWLVWDQLAQFSITATAEWLDWLPLGTTPIVRNFIVPLDDRFFSLLVFLHIGIPLLLLAGMWVHIQRVSHARTSPPRPLGGAVLMTLIAASVLHAATSHPPADPGTLQTRLDLDWLYMFVHPLQYWSSPASVWLLAVGVTLGLALLPLIFDRRRAPAAVVEPRYCNGCARCADDCPFSAITMRPRVGTRVGQRLPQVDANACAGCGICAGACPSSTPFRSTDALESGIDIPNRTVNALRARLESALGCRAGSHPIVVFGCERGASLSCLEREEVIAIPLICIAMLPPSFLEYALRLGARAVLVNACHCGECEFRLGAQWMQARLAGVREPHLRTSADPRRWTFVRAGPNEEEIVSKGVAVLRSQTTALSARVQRARLPRRLDG